MYRKSYFAILNLIVVSWFFLSSNALADDKKINSETESAYFMFNSMPQKESFIFKLTDPNKIREARAILNSTQKDKIHVSGTVIKNQ